MSSSGHSAAWPFDAMVSPKPIPFEQVRVRTDIANQAPPCTRNRLNASGRAIAVFQWNRLSNMDQGARTERAPVDADLQSADVLPRAAQHDLSRLPPPALPAHHAVAPQGTPSTQLPQPELRLNESGSGPAPVVGDPGSPERVTAADPVRAIVRTVRQATLLRGLIGTIAEVCDGGENQRLGPWDMTLPLGGHGLGRSTLNLRLSLGDLLLRFQCDGQDKFDLISAGAEGLRTELQETLRPPLDVRIETTLW